MMVASENTVKPTSEPTLRLTTQNGVEVRPGDRIVVAHNDWWHHQTSSFGQWFVALEKSAAAYDSPYDPIIWMPKTGYVGGSEQHKRKSEELRQLAELTAAAIRAAVRAGG